MKKSFLILGLMGGICAIDGFAARVASQDVVIAYSCPAGCYLDISNARTGTAGVSSVGCYYTNIGSYCGDPTYVIVDEGANKQQTKTARAAKITQKVEANNTNALSDDPEVKELEEIILKAKKDKKPGRVGAVSCHKGCTLVWEGTTATCTPQPQCGQPNIYGGDLKPSTSTDTPENGK